MASQSLSNGVLFLLLGNLFIGVSGYIVHLAVGRYYGPSDYGTYVVVIHILLLFELLFFSGVPQAVSKFISEKNDDPEKIKHAGVKLQMGFSAVLFLIYFLSADWIASLLNDESLVDLLRISSVSIPLSAGYALYDGYLNGLQRFRQQAAAIISHSVFKVTLIMASIFLGYSLIITVIGFSIAPIGGLVVCLAYTRWVKTKGSYPQMKLIKFSIPLIIASMAFLPMTTIDVFFVKAFVDMPEDVGYYSAASIISSAIYLIMQALAKPVFPKISYSTSKHHIKKTKALIYTSIKYSLLLLLPPCVLISASSTEFISFLYSPDYASAGEPLRLLIISFMFLSMFYLLTSIITASSKPKVTMALTLSALGLNCVLDYILVPSMGMMGAAIGTLIASVAGLIMALAYVWVGYRSIPIKSIIKIILSSLVVYQLFYLLQFQGIYLIIWMISLYLSYLVAMILVGEFKLDELRITE